MKRAISLSAAVWTVVLLLGSAAAAGDTPRSSPVEVATVAQGSIRPLQSFVGTLYYETKSEVAAEQEGAVAAVHFTEGKPVRRGDLLVTLDGAILASAIKAKEASLRAVEAELTRLERELERTKALFERKSIAEATYEQLYYGAEQVRAQADVLKNEIATLRIEREKMLIRAPFDAVITERNAERGEWIDKGAKVATLVAPRSIKGRVNVPTRLLGSLKPGDAVEAEVDAERIIAHVKTVILQADTATRTFPLELALQTDALLVEGMRIDVKLPVLEPRQALLVPRDAVVRRFGQSVVFAVIEGKAVMFAAEVIGYKENMAAVDAPGLSEGMEVVVKGNERVFPNTPVSAKKAAR